TFAQAHRLHAARLLPARPPARSPVRIGWTVVAKVDPGGRALEDIKLLRGRPKAWNRLHRGSAGADDADDLVGEPGKIWARVVVVPARGMEGVARIGLHALYLGELRLGQRTVRTDYELRFHRITAIGADVPEFLLLAPNRRCHSRTENREVVEVVAPRDRL